MKMNLSSDFTELSEREVCSIEGGLFGIAWLTGALLVKIFAGGVTLGAVGATTYLATK